MRRKRWRDDQREREKIWREREGQEKARSDMLTALMCERLYFSQWAAASKAEDGWNQFDCHLIYRRDENEQGRRRHRDGGRVMECVFNRACFTGWRCSTECLS